MITVNGHQAGAGLQAILDLQSFSPGPSFRNDFVCPVVVDGWMGGSEWVMINILAWNGDCQCQPI